MNSILPETEKQRIVKTPSKTSKKEVKSGSKKSSVLRKAKSTFKMKRGNQKGGGIIYIGHIPHGFYEDEMKSYFNQFGKVLSTVVARSKKTGRSKGYGFVEFKDEEVAKIAAETMNNYLMFNRILKCRYIPPEEKKGRIIERRITADAIPRQKHRKINEIKKQEALSKLSQSLYLKKAQSKINKFKKFFKERGIDFTFQIKSKDNLIEGSEEKTKATSTTASESESKNDTDEEFGILEIDENESEIYFKTPPKVKKIIKKSSTAPVKENFKSNNSQEGKERINLVKKSGLKKTQVKEKIRQKTRIGVNKKLKKKVENQKKAKKCVQVKELLGKNISSTPEPKKGKVKLNNKVPKKQRKTKA